MKKISIILSAFALIICSCTKEQPTSLLNISPDDDVASFTATFEGQGPETKLGINTITGVLSWANEDAIAVQMTDNTFVDFVYNSSDQKFYASLGGKTVKDGGVAYYPASIAIDGNPNSVNLPTSYSASVSDGVARVCPPMKATVDLGARALSLEHLGGILSVNVSHVPADADKLVLTVPQKTVTGTFTVDTDHISAGSKSSTVTIIFGNGILDSSAKEFYIPVPVTTFTGGFTVDFKNASDQTLYTHSTEKTSIEVGRAKIKRMENLTVPSYIYICDNTDASWNNVKVYAKNSSVQFTSNWPGDALTGDTYTHNGHSYKRIEIPAGQLGVSGGEVTLSGTADGGGEGTRDYVRAGVYNQTFNSDVYYFVSTTTPEYYKLYMEDQTGDSYNLKIHIWGNTNLPKTSWPGNSVSGLNSESLDGGLSTKYFIKTSPGIDNSFQWKTSNNGNDESGDQTLSADKNYIFYMTIWKSGESKWWYDYSYTPCTMVAE